MEMAEKIMLLTSRRADAVRLGENASEQKWLG